MSKRSDLCVAARSEAATIVSHDTLHLDALGSEEAQRVKEKAQAGTTLFVGQDFGASHTRVIIDCEMQVFPADAATVALPFAIAGDAVTDLLETAEFFDVEANDLAGMFALVAANRLGRLQRREPVEAELPQDPADGGRRDAELGGDLAAWVALPTQRLDGSTGGGRCLARQ